MHKLKLFVAALVMAMPFKASAVEIAPVGTTDVTVDTAVVDFLLGNGILPSPIAPATAAIPTFMFPITGGETGTLTITHSGGVRLDNGTSFVEVSDFVIEGGLGTVSGTVFGSDPFYATPISDADLFELDDVDLAGPITATLLFTDTLNEALGRTFLGDPDGLSFTGTMFGTASTSPTPVPVPAALPLLAGGVALLAVVRRRA